MKGIVFFDLDGTLTDSGLGIMNSTSYALKKLGIIEDRISVLKTFVGPPIREHAEELYGLSKEQSKDLVTYYREYFLDKGMYENSVYNGISRVLKNLKNTGKRLVLATSKPEIHARAILEYFDLLSYFDLIVGATLDGKISKKEDVINNALLRSKSDNESVIMVGDRRFDIEGGKKFNLATIGVTYGYGDREELEKAGADYIVDSAEELEKILMEI